MTTTYTPDWNDPTVPHWFDDPDEVVAFARWYYDGTSIARVSELIAFFEKPWKWEPEHRAYTAEKEAT